MSGARTKGKSISFPSRYQEKKTSEVESNLALILHEISRFLFLLLFTLLFNLPLVPKLCNFSWFETKKVCFFMWLLMLSGFLSPLRCVLSFVFSVGGWSRNFCAHFQEVYGFCGKEIWCHNRYLIMKIFRHLWARSVRGLNEEELLKTFLIKMEFIFATEQWYFHCWRLFTAFRSHK